MFDSPADAANALLEYFTRPRAELIVEALVPAMTFHPSKEIVIGGTRLGGTPDAPEGFVWPRPAWPEDPEEIAGRGNEDAAREMREHMAHGLPHAFIAQVDLSEAAGLGPVASSLPPDGRLLFFYDLSIGPWDTGSRAAKVIWERSPVGELRAAPMPEDLAVADERAARQWAEMSAGYDDGDEDAEADPWSNYAAPARAMTLQEVWRMPHPHALEIERLPEFAAVEKGETRDPELEDFYDAYQEALEAFHDLHPEEAWRRQQILGSPLPEQSDPRYDAVVVSEWGRQHLSREEWEAHGDDIDRKALDWVLLLQVDIADWMQARSATGTVYFVIQRDDLEQHRFDEVVAVYQQT